MDEIPMDLSAVETSEELESLLSGYETVIPMDGSYIVESEHRMITGGEIDRLREQGFEITGRVLRESPGGVSVKIERVREPDVKDEEPTDLEILQDVTSDFETAEEYGDRYRIRSGYDRLTDMDVRDIRAAGFEIFGSIDFENNSVVVERVREADQ